MIPKLSSKAVMDILEKSQDDIERMEGEVSTMRSELDRRLLVISNQLEYSMDSIEKAKAAKSATHDASSAAVMLCDALEGGVYNQFGLSLAPPPISTPSNVFNLMTSTGPIFKNNAQVFVNEKVQPGYTDMLMHDAINGKHAVFEEFDDRYITLEVRVNPNDLLGATSFNTIELLPFLPGSFDITKIRFYTMQDYKTQADTPSYYNDTVMSGVGADKIVFPENRNLYRCLIDIRLNYRNTAGKYPFGLKHLYFLMGNYNPNSSVTIKVKADNYIDLIGDDIILIGQDGAVETGCDAAGILLYLDNNNGVVDGKIETSKGLLHHPLARNVKEFYAVIPLKKALSAIKFKNIVLR